MWQRAGEWLGRDLGFVSKGALTLAFTDAEAELLAAQTVERSAAGAANEIVTLERARRMEPGLSERPVMVSYCPLDGLVAANLAGLALGQALRRAGVEVREEGTVTGIERSGAGYILDVDGEVLAAARVVLAGGAWLVPMARWLGFDLPFGCYVNQIVVTERMAPFLGSTIGVARRRLTCKQAANGTVLIGGGWQGEGDPQRGAVALIHKNLVGNIRLARHCVPALEGARAVRAWLGLQDKSPRRPAGDRAAARQGRRLHHRVRTQRLHHGPLRGAPAGRRDPRPRARNAAVRPGAAGQKRSAR